MSRLLSYRMLLRAEWYANIIDLEQCHASILRTNVFSSLPLFLLKGVKLTKKNIVEYV